ncbi:alpha/beta fold hydrolase [Blastopirellula sp. J2-11]|uniref:carboxylesterase family protein n=1 Tax=Blastopirellula sp. J2-11 TaxID=2943192 RepID=UPI0021C81ACB|nr:alpha/beta fold hydrolase [Blastopirellula sp. J2-11]UUO04987.1 alpha/beta fold hydrolase [Blastopirellula sp. J2-11]
MNSASASSSVRQSRRRLAGELAFVIAFWVAANLIAFRIIDLYERNADCTQYGLPFEVAMKFEDRKAPLVDLKYGDRKFARYELLAPLKQEFGRRYPLILYLHGLGERGDDNVRQLRSLPALLASDAYRERYPCYLVAPQCSMAAGWWFVRNRQPGATFPDELDAVCEILNHVIKTCAVDVDRIYVIGFSMGGYGAWELACRCPDRFAAVIPVAGGGSIDRAELLRETTIWAIHGAADDVVSPAGSRDMIAAIRAAGGTPHYSELAGVGHGVWEPVFRDSHELLDWLFQQKRRSVLGDTSAS